MVNTPLLLRDLCCNLCFSDLGLFWVDVGHGPWGPRLGGVTTHRGTGLLARVPRPRCTVPRVGHERLGLSTLLTDTEGTSIKLWTDLFSLSDGQIRRQFLLLGVVRSDLVRCLSLCNR